jgi:hypothetical protein
LAFVSKESCLGEPVLREKILKAVGIKNALGIPESFIPHNGLGKEFVRNPQIQTLGLVIKRRSLYEAIEYCPVYAHRSRLLRSETLARLAGQGLQILLKSAVILISRDGGLANGCESRSGRPLKTSAMPQTPKLTASRPTSSFATQVLPALRRDSIIRDFPFRE